MLIIKHYGPIKEPYVSVIIPVYNEEQSIGDCVLSLDQQSFSPLEIIVVDDGSTDNSVNVCKDAGIEVYLQDHRGPGAARNLGARNARGNILVLIDADMTFAPNYIEKLIMPIINNEAIATCHWNERVANWDNPWARCQTWFLGLPDMMRQPPLIPPHEVIYRAVRKDFFLASGGFTEGKGRGDDASMARTTGVTAKIVPDAICYHRNVSSLQEAFTEGAWSGRDIAVEKKDKIKRCLFVLIMQKNPILEIFRGFRLSVVKKEYRLIQYSISYVTGFVYGVLNGLFGGYYLK